MSLPPFSEVVAAHGLSVLRVCRAVVPGADAEDAAADALLAALQAYPRLRPGSDVRAWLVTIAHRKAIDVARRRARTVAMSPAVASHDPPSPAEADERLWAALRSLPDKQRTAVTLRHVGDLAYAEVASVMGTTEEAARRSTSDGLKALRRLYPHEEVR